MRLKGWHTKIIAEPEVPIEVLDVAIAILDEVMKRSEVLVEAVMEQEGQWN
jgi:hypothetical protein